MACEKKCVQKERRIWRFKVTLSNDYVIDIILGNDVKEWILFMLIFSVEKTV